MRRLSLVLVLLFPSLSLAVEETAIRQQLSTEVTRYFEARQFSTLNDIEERLRISKERTPSGLMKLTMFYSHAFARTPVRESVALAKEWATKFEIVDEWIAATPNAQAPYLSKARMLINYAWNQRGTAVASKVSERSMRKFRRLIEDARKVLVDAEHIAGNNPYWFALMARVAKFQGWDETDLLQLFERAVEVAPDYYQIYFAFAGYYQPMWHGSPEQMRQFVDLAIDRAVPEDPDVLYARIYWSQGNSLQTGNIFKQWADWERMSRGFEKLLVQYPDSAWNLNAYAYFACKGSYWKTADRLLDEIGDDFASGAWGPWDPRGLMEVCKEYAREQVAAGKG